MFSKVKRKKKSQTLTVQPISVPPALSKMTENVINKKITEFTTKQFAINNTVLKLNKEHHQQQ